MQSALTALLGCSALGLLFLFLYQNGGITLNNIGALSFTGSHNRAENRSNASFLSCNGSMRRVVKLKSSHNFRFFLDCELTSGTVTFELLDQNRQSLLTLDPAKRTASIFLDAQKKYYLVARFHSASGSYTFHWTKEDS